MASHARKTIFFILAAAMWAAALAFGALGQPAEPPTFGQGESARVGDLVYQIRRAWWEDFGEARGPSPLLAVELRVRNSGSSVIEFSPFTVVTSSGTEYEPNYSRLVWPKMSVNPGEIIEGKFYFSPPRGLRYRLLVSGGFVSRRFAFLTLEPAGTG